jgi:hypothetical protein
MTNKKKPIKWCYVNTKWGIHRARILVETIHEGIEHTIVEMVSPQFRGRHQIQVFESKIIQKDED